MTGSFPQSLHIIGSEAFEECGIQSLDFSSTNLTHISSLAFWRCKSLERIVFPDCINFIGRSAFCDCSVLSELMNLPQSKIEISKSAFRGCPIKNLNHPSIQIKNGLVVEKNAVVSYTSEPSNEMEIPSGVDTIEKDAIFTDSSELLIGEGVKIIKPDAILSDTLLFVSLPASLEKISQFAFGDEDHIPPVIENRSKVKLEWENTRVLQHDDNIKYCLRDERFVIGVGNGRTSLVYAVPDFDNLLIEVPDDVSFIEHDAFKDCADHYITLPNGFITNEQLDIGSEIQECVCGENSFILPSWARINRYFQI